VAVTYVGLVNSSAGMAVSLTGVDTGGSNEANNGSTSSNANSIQTSVTTIADNSWVVDVVAMDSIFGPLSTGGSTTERENVGVSSGDVGMGTQGPITPAGSTAMDWDDTGGLGSPDWSHAVGAFKVAAADVGALGEGTLEAKGLIQSKSEGKAK